MRSIDLQIKTGLEEMLLCFQEKGKVMSQQNV